MNNSQQMQLATNTHISKLIKINQVIKRTMLKSAYEVANIGKMQISNIVCASVPQYRPLRILAGKIKDKQASAIMPSITKDIPEVVQSDQTGFHKVVVVESCSDKQCHKKQCDIVHEKVCTLKTGESYGTAELGGTLTHKVPFDKNGVELDPYDINGETKYGSQKLVKEKTTVPVDKSKFKQDEIATDYVQQWSIAEKVKDHLPPNSPLNLKETSHCNAPKDEEI